MDTFSVRLTGEDRAALRAAAAAKGVRETEMIRQLVRRGLAVESSDAQVELLVSVVRRAIEPLIEPTRKFSYLALREATKARYFARGNGAMYFLDHRAKGDVEMQRTWRRERDYEANKVVRRLLREEDPEQTDEAVIEAEAMDADEAEEERVDLTPELAAMFEGQDAVDESGPG